MNSAASPEQQARTLWNTMREIERMVEALGFGAHLSDSYGRHYEVTFRRLNPETGSPVRGEAGYLGVARTMSLSPITVTASVPADIRAAIAHLLG